MQKTFVFRKGYITAHVDVNYSVKNASEKRLSICGTLYAPDTRCSGQCLDEIAKYIDSERFKIIYRLWKLYHLNDMHAECEHQAAAGWLEKKPSKR